MSETKVPNKERGEVALELGGEVFVARPAYAAIVEIREKTGHPLAESFRRVRDCDVVEMAQVLGPCLRAAGNKLTDAQVGERIVAMGVLKAIDETALLIENILTGGVEPEPEAADSKKKPAKTTKAKSRSGASSASPH